ncbi:DUF3265 domain-containing protein [Photobacterium angustum]|uniref:DUF3265 domain-containing protein n=1 Tax=Photobacterium angustum TaxID=661 RepID=A0ABX5HB05_PHOAN|nr:DUF3265 domain-containing protein [Photobacterium angustum]
MTNCLRVIRNAWHFILFLVVPLRWYAVFLYFGI